MKYVVVVFLIGICLVNSEELVQIFPINQDEVQKLTHNRIPVIAQIENSYIALLNCDEIARLNETKIDYQLISSAPPSEDFYIVTPPENADLNYCASVVAQYATILLTYEGRFLVSGRPSMIEYLPNLRYHIAHIPRSPMVLESRFLPEVKPSNRYNAVVKWVIDQITPGELAQLIRDLSGENPVVVGGRTDTILTRHANWAKNSVAIRYYYEKMRSYGVDSVVYHPFSTDSNVIATRVGRVYPRQQYLIGGHIDDMPNASRAPGADDNATGTVAGMICAKYIRGIPFKRTIKFVAWNQEELGLIGSEAYASQAAARRDSIQGYFNADMIAYETSNFDSIRCYNGNRAGSIILSNKFNQMNIDYNLGLRIRLSTSTPTNSDHYSFWRNGFEAVDIYEDDANPYYHTANDRITTLDTIYYTKVVKCMVAAVLELAEPDTVFQDLEEKISTKLNRAISIRPNPARKFVTFTVNDPQFENGMIKIYDTSGKLITEYNSLQAGQPLYLNLSPGVYFARYITLDQVVTKKFILVE
ncbi:MAG: M28 family peptidase [candidate division WOR-3 bacterium]